MLFGDVEGVEDEQHIEKQEGFLKNNALVSDPSDLQLQTDWQKQKKTARSSSAVFRYAVSCLEAFQAIAKQKEWRQQGSCGQMSREVDARE